VLRGRVHDGMDQDAVTIAWGRPDFVTKGGDKAEKTEVWIYEHQLTQYAPLRSYEDLYYSRVGNAGGYRSPMPGSPWGAMTGPFAGQSFYQSNVIVIGYRHRKALFVNGKLKAYSDWGRRL
jgi:hypothetical protein